MTEPRFRLPFRILDIRIDQSLIQQLESSSQTSRWEVQLQQFCLHSSYILRFCIFLSTSEADLQTVGDAPRENLDQSVRTRSPCLPLSPGPQCSPVSHCCHPRVHIYPSQTSKISDSNLICQRSHLEIPITRRD